MARVRPFLGVTYAGGTDITTRCAPPYDVIDEDMRERLLAQDDLNVVALELAEGPLDPHAPGNRYQTAATRWKTWLESGTLVRDGKPAVYLLDQRFTLGGRPLSRKAIVAAVGLEPFSAGIILPHERTLPKALSDRLHLIRATAANFSPVLGLYSDIDRRVDALLARGMDGEPYRRAVDADGTESVLWRVTDAAACEDISELLGNSPIFIADGHHRYTVALEYRDERRDAEGDASSDPAYDYVMMALVSMDDPDLAVLPTHRVVSAAGAFDASEFLRGLERLFEVRPVAEHPAEALMASADRPTFLMKVRGDAVPLLVRLRPEVDPTEAIPGSMSDEWKRLDVAVLQELILRPLLGVHPDEPETLDRLEFVKDAHAALRMAESRDVAFIMNATRLEQLRAVSLSHEIMPQKSTYFYPKVLSGLVFRSLD